MLFAYQTVFIWIFFPSLLASQSKRDEKSGWQSNEFSSSTQPISWERESWPAGTREVTIHKVRLRKDGWESVYVITTITSTKRISFNFLPCSTFWTSLSNPPDFTLIQCRGMVGTCNKICQDWKQSNKHQTLSWSIFYVPSLRVNEEILRIRWRRNSILLLWRKSQGDLARGQDDHYWQTLLLKRM